MKLYYTPTSPYARLVRIIIKEKELESSVELVEAKTRTPNSPYYAVNPSGRVPFLARDGAVGIEDSQLICRFLDGLDGRPRFQIAPEHGDWQYGRLEAYARSMVDGISVHLRELRRPEGERSPTILSHEKDRAQRLADFWEREVSDPLMQGEVNLAQLLLVIALDTGRMARIGELEASRPELAAWAGRMRLRPSVKETAPMR